MKVPLVRIGNSRGIRIPKLVIDECGFGDTVDLRIESDRLVVAPDRPPRQRWESAFRAAGPAGEIDLPDTLPPNAFDREEWQW